MTLVTLVTAMRSGWCVLLAVLAAAGAENLYEVMEARPELSEFMALIRPDGLLSQTLKQAEGTVFAPTNAALQKFAGTADSKLISYHIMNLAMSYDQLKSKQSEGTTIKGSQKLFFTVQKRPYGGDDIFVNNAKIVTRDVPANSSDKSKQYLHIIDEVLQPTIPSGKDGNMLFNPSALHLLTHSARYGLGEATIKRFYQKVQQVGKTGVFANAGFNTYFIPVDTGMEGVEAEVDRVVVDGHVIANKVLFTRTMGNDSYKTTTFTDFLKVTAQLLDQAYPQQTNGSFYEVQSRTIVGDSEHSAGTVLAKIVRPNIAVENGVVHLIEKPLMVMGSSALEVIQRGSEDRFFEFLNLLKNNAPNFLDNLRQRRPGTIFIPSNDAFYKVDQKRLTEIKLSPERLEKLLNLHLVKDRVTIHDVLKMPNTTSPYSVVQSEDLSRPLYLSVWGTPGKNQTMTVDGGGTNASVVVADIVAKDGVIHIIDKLLGVPYRSVGGKLAVDGLTSDTNTLAAQTQFSYDVRRMDRQFTMFVPSNEAWQQIKFEYPTSHKYLFAGRATHQATTILERHFLIDEALDMDELVNKSIVGGENGVKFYKTSYHVEEIVDDDTGKSGYLVKWQGMEARVTRPNVECTNGYIHIIDSVFMRQRDVTTVVASVAPLAATSAACLAAALALLRL